MGSISCSNILNDDEDIIISGKEDYHNMSFLSGITHTPVFSITSKNKKNGK